MESRYQKIKIILRIIILIAGLTAFVYSFVVLKSFMRSLFSLVFCILSIVELFHYLNKMHNDFKYFIQALIYEDFSNYYKSEDSKSIYNLFNQLNTKYRKIASDKEVQYALIQTIIQNISIGIIVSDDDNNIELINQNINKLLKCGKLRNLDDLIIKYPILKDKMKDSVVGKPELIELQVEGELLKLSMNISKFKLEGRALNLISFQDINIELDEQELLAWQKLIRVLTHEIMNSVTPISSLSSSLNKLLSNSILDNRIDQKNLDYLVNGLNAVQERSEGLIKFTESYKKLTQLKHPEYRKVSVQPLLEGILVLFKSEIEKNRIKTEISCANNSDIYADKLMIEQVLINLVKNSIEELTDTANPILKLNYFKENERAVIQVKDNGHGIVEDKIDKIFIPFFTTKEKGSGIGLSFARQIMRLHRGNISAKSISRETIFTLKF